MAKRIQIRGVIVPNNYAWYYDFFGEEYTCPDKVRQAIESANGEELIVEINSPGGEIASGSEIYAMLQRQEHLKIEITGEACSAASIIAMAGYCEMATTALMMVHCVSTSASGNHSRMEKTAETLRVADEALASAYMKKSGMSKAEALAMMERESWLTAEQAKEKGLIDAIIGEEREEGLQMSAGLFRLPTEAQMEQVRRAMTSGNSEKESAENHARVQLRILGLKGKNKNQNTF